MCLTTFRKAEAARCSVEKRTEEQKHEQHCLSLLRTFTTVTIGEGEEPTQREGNREGAIDMQNV